MKCNQKDQAKDEVKRKALFQPSIGRVLWSARWRAAAILASEQICPWYAVLGFIYTVKQPAKKRMQD